MKLKQIYLLSALACFCDVKIYGMEQSTNLFENNHWRSVYQGIVLAHSNIENAIQKSENESILRLHNLISVYIDTMKPEIDKWKKSQDTRFLEALRSITGCAQILKKLSPYMDRVFHSYIESNRFQEAYVIEPCFQVFRGHAHGLFKRDNFSDAIPLLSVLLKMYPDDDLAASILKAQDRFYLMTAYMKTGQYKSAEELSDDVRAFIAFQSDTRLNHLQLSICATSAFVNENHDKAMDIINDKIEIEKLPDEDYLIMSILYKNITTFENKDWKEKIDAFDMATMTRLLNDTLWLREIISQAHIDQTTESLLPEPSNPTEKLIQDTLLLEDQIREDFEEQDYEKVTVSLAQRKKNLELLEKSIDLPEMVSLKEHINSSIFEIRSNDDQMQHYDFFIKFYSHKYQEAALMKDAVLRSFVENREDIDPKTLHYLVISIFISQGSRKAFEFLPNLEQRASMDVETWVLSLFLRAKMKHGVDEYIDMVIPNMKEASLTQKELSEIQEWVNDAADLLPGDNGILFRDILNWIDPVKYDERVSAKQILERELQRNLNDNANQGKQKKSKKRQPKKSVNNSSMSMVQEQEEKKLKIQEEQRIAREAAQTRKEKIQEERLKREALEKEEKRIAKSALKKQKKEKAVMEKREKMTQNLDAFNQIKVRDPSPERTYYWRSLREELNFLSWSTLTGAQELIFQKEKHFSLKIEKSVGIKEINGMFYAVYAYNPFSILYARDKAIPKGTLGIATKPSKEGDQLVFTVIVE